jgi:uncharacterized RDD family membrane protein YckC
VTETPHRVVRLWIAAPYLRFGAALIDLIVLYTLAQALEPLVESVTVRWDELIIVLPDFLFFWLLHARWGRTVGKLLLGIKVVSPDTGRPPSLRASALRAAFFVLVPLVPLVGLFFLLIDLAHMFVNSRRQCYHDLWANTVVVRAGALGRSAGEFYPQEKIWPENPR